MYATPAIAFELPETGTADWVAVGVAVGALVVAVLTYFGSRAEARKARWEAKRSADAAVRSAAAEERAVALAEAQAEAEANRVDVRFELVRVGGAAARLTNAGDRDTAYNVTVSSELMNEPENFESIPPGSSALCQVLSPRWGQSNYDVAVTFYTDPLSQGEPFTWTYPLP